MEKKEKVTLYWFSKEITRMMSGNWNSSIAKRIDPIGSSCNGSGQCFVFTHMRIVFPFFFFPRTSTSSFSGPIKTRSFVMGLEMGQRIYC